MKRFNKKYIGLLSLATLFFSCAELDYEVESGVEVEKPASVIVNEKVSSYDVLKTYSGDLILGADASRTNISEGSMATLLETNFEQVTPLTALYPNLIISNDGYYDFGLIDAYVSTAQERGLSVYGDAIVSNSNQNDAYLNSLIAPFTYSTPLYPNIVSSAAIKDGAFTGWGINGEVSVEDYLGNPSVKFVNGVSVSGGDATSMQSPVYTVEDGAKFEMTFYLLSNKVGEGRVTFTGLNNNEPEMDWMGKGIPSATFTTKIGWNKIQFQTDDFDESGEFSFKIELGYTPEVTYYLNIQGLSVINLNGSVDNPDEIFLECEKAQEIGEWMTLLTDNEVNVSGGEYLSGIINGDFAANDTYAGLPSEDRNKPYSFTYTFNVRTAGTYNIWLRQRARVGDGGDDSFFMSVDGAEYFCPGWPGWGDDSNTSNWTWLKLYSASNQVFDLTEGEHKISLKIREGDHHFDKIYLTMTNNEPSGLGSAVIAQEEVTLEISDAEKKGAIEKELNEYVTNVITNAGDNISAWTVVKNPLAPNGSVATSDGSAVEGTFYWADYIGGDYIAQAFVTAQASGNENDLMFISETDLNTNSAKRDAIVSIVNNTSEIDGIAVSLQLNLDSDLDDVGLMLEQLAATGKYIYITNFGVEVDEATEEMYALQSEVYKSVVDLYKSKVPAGQQYGISLSVLANDNAGLWSSGYNRKQAYAGFAVGLGAQE